MRGGRSFEDGEGRRRRVNIFEDGEMVCLVFEKKEKLTLGGRRRSVIYLEGARMEKRGSQSKNGEQTSRLPRLH